MVGRLLNADSINNVAVVEVESEATQAKVTLSEVQIAADEGKSTLREYFVGNRSEFEISSAFKSGVVAVLLGIGPVTEDKVHIKEILIIEPVVTYEWKPGGSNFEMLKCNVKKFAGIDDGESCLRVTAIRLVKSNH